MAPGDPLHIPTIGLDPELQAAIASRPGEELLALAGTALLGREQKDLARMSLDMRRDNPLDKRDPLFVWNQTATVRPEIKKPLAQLIRNRRNHGSSLLVSRAVEKKSFSHFKMRFYFDYSSGSVTESVLRDTPYGYLIFCVFPLALNCILINA